jgi:EAL domain-containing protein (putative c-di-GMP-specific phosphodiesterase class I)
VTTLHRLGQLGVRLAIDDFGTGYSSLAYLKRLAVNTLKIDQSFVRNLPDPGRCQYRVRHHRHGAQAAAAYAGRGVETAQIADMLQAMGCEQAQGYHFARPPDQQQDCASCASRRQSAGRQIGRMAGRNQLGHQKVDKGADGR